MGVTFQDRTLLYLAFVHRSFWNEHREQAPDHNERLEFLGDSLLGFLIADHLVQEYPHLDEGFLSKRRAQLVEASSCRAYVQQLGIGAFLLLGKGELANEGRGRESIEADLFEALIGALYLDQGVEVVRRFFFSHFRGYVDQVMAQPASNGKAELQEWAQRQKRGIPEYRLLEEGGEAHRKYFRVAVWIGGEVWGEGRGASKKEAQARAAEEALRHIPNREL